MSYRIVYSYDIDKSLIIIEMIGSRENIYVVESAVDDASISVNVEGTGFVHFNVTTDGGGQKTGWWYMP